MDEQKVQKRTSSRVAARKRADDPKSQQELENPRELQDSNEQEMEGVETNLEEEGTGRTPENEEPLEEADEAERARIQEMEREEVTARRRQASRERRRAQQEQATREAVDMALDQERERIEEERVLARDREERLARELDAQAEEYR